MTQNLNGPMRHQALRGVALAAKRQARRIEVSPSPIIEILDDRTRFADALRRIQNLPVERLDEAPWIAQTALTENP